MHWILILTIFARQGVAVTSIEFNMEQTCRFVEQYYDRLQAANTTKAANEGFIPDLTYNAICTPKG